MVGKAPCNMACAHHHHHLVARPLGGTNTGLNRKEYLLARVLEGALDRIARQVDENAGSVREALAGFDHARRAATGPALRTQIRHYTALTFQSGAANAVTILHRGGHRSSAVIFAAPKKKPSMTPWSTVVDKLTDHTIDNFDRIADDLKDRLKVSLREGYANGEGASDLADRVQESLGVDKNRAIERARTLTMETYNQAHLAQYSEAGIPGIEILGAPDERQCDYCADMDGMIFALTDPNLLYPPFHNYCRCTVLPYLDAIPDDAAQPSAETVDFITEWTDKYFDVPCYALGES
jgi:SPP1 gp7 family putative phage head morphogenesis protein